MLRHTLIVGLLLLLTGLSATVAEGRGLQRIESAVPEDIRRQENFDAAESAGLFVGVRNFEDKLFAEVPYAVDDAVDLAYLFAVELSLLTPERVTLALAGEPQKKSSQDRLQALLAAGARQQPAGWADIHEGLTESREATGPRGVFVVALATHGFNQDGQDYLVGADSRHRFIIRSGISVAEVLGEIAQAAAPRRLMLLDACRERLKIGERPRRGRPDAESAMGAAFAEAIAAAKGQVVLSGTTLGGYSYDDVKRGNGVFTGAVLDGLRGAAPADERHFITPQTLANYVNTRVVQWVRDNRPEHVKLSRGISRQIEGSMARAPLAIDPGGIRSDERARQQEALRNLRDNFGGPITGSLYDVIAQALDSPLPFALRAELLDELEALDGSNRPKRSLAYWVAQHRSQLAPGEAAAVTPAAEPSPALQPPPDEPDPVTPAPSPPTYRLTVRATPADSSIRIMNIRPRYSPGMELKPGRYDVLVERRDHQSVRQWVAIDAADVAVDVVLPNTPAPSPPTYRLTVRATPADSSIRILNIQPNYSPGMELKPGRYDVLVERRGHQSVRQWVVIDAADVAVDVVLPNAPAPSPPTYRLTVRATPADSSIRILNIQPNYSPGMELKPGRYDVLVERRDHQSVRQWVVIDAADVAVDVVLPNTAAAAESAALAMLQEAIGWYAPQNGQTDYARARRLFAQAAQSGQPLAVMWLARSYVAGRVGFAKDVERAQELARRVIQEIRRLARNGDREALFLLGSAYNDGLAVTQDDEQAVSWYRKAADQGHRTAQLNLGWMYENGRGVAQSDREAVKWYRMAADQGYAAAQNNLGLAYQNGRGVAQSDREAVKWYRKAADQGYAAAQFNLGWMYHSGRGVAQSDREAVKWYRMAADQGEAKGQYSLGGMYHSGRGVAQSDREAVKWYRMAADQGYAAAQSNLGWMYRKGRGVAQSHREAVKWYRKAADQGYARAQNSLGWMYEEGHGVAQSDREAVKWYRMAADQGYAAAQSNLGWMYRKGRGVAQSHREAVKWYRKAADQGYANAQFNLGLAYSNGRGVAQSGREAVKWYRKAADQGYANAQYNLGVMYDNGRGVTQDYAEAVKWYRKAAEQGHSWAQRNLGISYDNGQGVTQDHAEAVKWYRKAAGQGLINAYADLGVMYARGLGVPKDYAEAIKWYRKGAERGYAVAQRNLGEMYAKGLGVPKDNVQAYAWYAIAATQGNAFAEKNMKLAAESMTLEESARAQELARDYLEAYVLRFRK